MRLQRTGRIVAITAGTFWLSACAPESNEQAKPKINTAPIVAEQVQGHDGKTVDPDTVAAYERLGATYGGLVKGPFRTNFVAGRSAAGRGLPAFQFKGIPKDQLPDVAVPFGLEFASSKTPTDVAIWE